MAWHTGKVRRCVSEVVVCRARLVLGWVTVFNGHTNPVFLPSHLGQLSTLPSSRQEMSTSQRVMTLGGWGVKAG